MPSSHRRPRAAALHPPDEDLVAQAQRGDRAAFAELVRRHADRLYAVLLRFSGDREEAEEAMQETFLRAWRRIDAFRGDSQFFTWLYRIGINEAKRRAERRPSAARAASTEEGTLEDVADEAPGPSERAEQAELRRALERAIRALPERYRLPIVLRDVEGLSTAEAAQVMQLKEPAFKTRLHRARMAVREALGEYLAEAESERPSRRSEEQP